MSTLSYQKKLIFPILASALISPLASSEPLQLPAQSMTQLGDHSPKPNKTAAAEPLPQEVVSGDPSNWLAHATKSYSLWRQGNIFAAINEGETAAKLNPTNTIALTNLALMMQNSNYYRDAVSLYQIVIKLSPDNWVPPLGIARCSILMGNQGSGIKALRAMSEQNDRSFDWYYMTAKTCREIDQLNLAEKTASRAIFAAPNPEQRSAAENLLFQILLRENKCEEAKSLQDRVFHHNHPHESELYVRAALALLPVADPNLGKDLLHCAIENLTTPQDSDAFLKLGRICESKASDQTNDQTCRASWIENAQAAYTQAIALTPTTADPHFALAGIFSRKGLLTDAVEELKKTISLNRMDILSPVLIAKILNSKEPRQEHSIPLNFSLARFRIEGLTCSCQLSKVYGALQTINGVAFISTPPKKPYTGLALVDQSLIPASAVISNCSQNILPTKLGSEKHPLHVKLEMISAEPVKTVDEALKIAEDVKFGPILSFQRTFTEYFNRFKEIAPIVPFDNSDTASGVQTASNWNASL